jgi:type I restriction enzyme, S subunit
MALSRVVKLYELEGKKRIDPEYYMSDIPNVKEITRKTKFKVVKLRQIMKKGYRVVYWATNIIPRENMKSDDVFFLQASNIDDSFPYIRSEEMGGVWHKDWEDYPEGRVMIGELLIEVKGKAEKVALVPEGFPRNTLVSGSLFKLSIRDVEPEYVLVYLLTKYGKGFRDRLKTNLLVAFVNREDLLNIPVVVLPPEVRKSIKKLYLDAYESFRNSELLYSKAQMLLLRELELESFIKRYELSYNARLSYAFEACRLDAEYFQPVYQQMIRYLISRVELRPLQRFVINFRKGTEVGSESYQEKGKLFIRVGNLSVHGFIERDQKYISEDLYKQLFSVYGVRVGDFLLTKDATPGIAYVVKEPVEGIIASGILKLAVNDNEINKEYLALCINSMIGKLQIERDCGGSVITHWRPGQVRKLLIPILPYKTQQKISSLVWQSHEARRKSKELLEEAKRRVEEAIETQVAAS